MDALEGFHRKNEWHDLMYVHKVPKLGGGEAEEKPLEVTGTALGTGRGPRPSLKAVGWGSPVLNRVSLPVWRCIDSDTKNLAPSSSRARTYLPPFPIPVHLLKINSYFSFH